jgi:hypothetical protein
LRKDQNTIQQSTEIELENEKKEKEKETIDKLRK